MIISADEYWSRQLAQSLSGKGRVFQIVDAKDEKHLQSCDSKEPDVLLVDVQDLENGAESYVQRVRDRYPLTEIIVLYSPESVESTVKAVRNGAFDFLPKTMGKDVILLKVFAACRRKKISQKRMEILMKKGEALWDER